MILAKRLGGLRKVGDLRSLRSKLLLPILGLMLLSLLGSTGAFVLGTALTRNQLLRQQIAADERHVSNSMEARIEVLETAATLLADDPEVAVNIQGKAWDALDVLNNRAVAVRNRFELDLIQLYDQDGRQRANVLLSPLFRESSMLDYVKPGYTVVKVVQDHVLLLNRVEIAGEGGGSVVVGIDLELELHRLVSDHRLFSDLLLSVEGKQVATADKLHPADKANPADEIPQEMPEGWGQGCYSRHVSMSLGRTPVDLMLVRPTTDIAQVTRTGLLVMVTSTLLTTLLLVVLSIAVTRSIVQPIRELSEAAESVARGDLGQRVSVDTLVSPLGIGQHDEIGVLATAFNSMISELQDLYGNLEAKVAARTTELAVAAEVAHAVSTSLDLDVVLRKSVHLIHQRLGFHRVGIFIVNDETNRAVLRQAITGAIARDPSGPSESQTVSPELQIPLRDNSIVGMAALTHSPWVVQDVAKSRFDYAGKIHPAGKIRPVDSHLSPDTCAVAEIPLLASNTLVGVLDVQSSRPHAFSQETLNLLETLADQVATGVQNARLYESEQRRRHLTELLELTGRALSSSLDLGKLPGRVLSLLNTLVPYDRGLLLLQQGDKLKPLDSYGFPDDPRLETLALPVQGGDIFQRLIDTSGPLIVDDVSLDPRWHQVPWLPLHHSWLGAPIISKGQVIGMVSLTRQAPNAFHHEDAAWVQSVAMQAGIALENANLHAEVTRYNEQLEQMVQARTKALKRANQVLERLDSAKSKFINIAAHELRTPLTVIKAYAQVLGNLFQTEENPKLEKMLSGILAGSERLHEIINSMLDVAKIDNQNLKMVKTKTSLAHIIESVCAGFKSDLIERDLTLNLGGLDDLPFIHADHDLLTKVFYHLIINAIKYTPNGGCISITGEVQTPEEAPASSYVEIVVSDTGIGIDPAYQEVIFEKFYQTGEVAFHSSGRTKFKGGGPGLGLAIVRGIVLAHGGEIWVDSDGYDEENCPGSCFHVRLPISRGERISKDMSPLHTTKTRVDIQHTGDPGLSPDTNNVQEVRVHSKRSAEVG